MRRSPDRAPARRRGPHTSVGKTHAARNALRYGLSLPVLADPATAAEVDALACQLAPAADAVSGGLARAVAQAQVDLVRIRRARLDLVRIAFKHLADDAEGVADNARTAPIRFPDLLARLVAIERYERRARSRRKFAIREFNAVRRSAPTANTHGSVEYAL